MEPEAGRVRRARLRPCDRSGRDPAAVPRCRAVGRHQPHGGGGRRGRARGRARARGGDEPDCDPAEPVGPTGEEGPAVRRHDGGGRRHVAGAGCFIQEARQVPQVGQTVAAALEK